MTTLGEVQIRLSKLPCGAGVDKTVLLGIINDVYQRYLNAYQWSRLVKTATLQTTAVYQTGTIAVSTGGTTLTGTSTVWISGMTGRRIRIAGHNESYVFTYVSATSATIDRPYEGSDETAATYTMFQSVYPLAVDVDLLDSVEVPGNNRDLDAKSAEYLDKLQTDRWAMGRPSLYTPAPDMTISNVIYPAIELYPVPEAAEGLTYRYRSEITNLSSTAHTFLPWVQIECIIAGCKADLYEARGEIPSQQIAEAKFMKLLDEAISSDADRQFPDGVFMDERYTWHRTARALNHDSFNRHWWQLRNSN